MFNKNSDYALNKLNPNAIVCSSVTGDNIELACEQFASEEEFLYWKQWSDNDYQTTEDTGRGYYDHTIPLIEELDAVGLCFEDMLIALMEQDERGKQCREQIAMIRSVLTETQFRRLWLHYAEGKTHQEIADMGGVGRRRVTTSIDDAREKIKNFSKQAESGGPKWLFFCA